MIDEDGNPRWASVRDQPPLRRPHPTATETAAATLNMFTPAGGAHARAAAVRTHVYWARPAGIVSAAPVSGHARTAAEHQVGCYLHRPTPSTIRN